MPLASNVMADVLDMDKAEAGVVDWAAVASRKIKVVDGAVAHFGHYTERKTPNRGGGRP